MAAFNATLTQTRSEPPEIAGPPQAALDRCVHCGLCLNACPTYRVLGLEMDSPRGRIYQMNLLKAGRIKLNELYVHHLSLCLACRGCETACPSGVQYGLLIESARAYIQANYPKPLARKLIESFAFEKLLPSRRLLNLIGNALWLTERIKLRAIARKTGLLKLVPRIEQLDQLALAPRKPFFFRYYGRTIPAEGQRRYRVGMLGGCVANVFFSRMNEATLRVLTKNGCEVVIPNGQTCCGALHVHSGWRRKAQQLARKNIDAFLQAGVDAVIVNAAGCGSTMKEYAELLAEDPLYSHKAENFVRLCRDFNEFLADVGLSKEPGQLSLTVTYQDSCHLVHGQKIRKQPRKLLSQIPGLKLKEMANPDICCGSAGIYNLVHTDVSLQILKEKMAEVEDTGAEAIVTANPGCMLQLEAGARLFGRGQKVYHVAELLDLAYGHREAERG